MCSLGRLVRAFCGGPSRAAMAQSDRSTPLRIAPHRPADASRSVSIAGGEVELALLCAEGLGHAAGFGEGVSRALCTPRSPGCVPE